MHAFVSVHAYVLVYLCVHKIFNTLISVRNTILNKSKTYLMVNLEFVKLYVSALHSYMKLEIKNLVLSSLIICYKKLFFFYIYSIWKPFFYLLLSCEPVHVEISATYSASDLGSDCDYACFLASFQNGFFFICV